MCWYRFLLRPFVSRFIAGETLAQALSYGKKLQRRGVTPIFDILGEETSGREGAVRTSETYMTLIDRLHRERIPGAISLKLTAFALDEDEETCYRAVARVVRHAHEAQILVWIDMEGSGYTSQTLRVYKRLLHQYDNVGICIQTYLKRAKKDILSLLPDHPKIRLVKGVYPQKSKEVYSTHTAINTHFKELITLLSEKDAWTAIGTHDRNIISHALGHAFPTHMEFQMLKGIRDHEKFVLAEHGYAVCEYVPFGEHWEKYVLRRLLERARNVKWIIQSYLGIK